MTELLPRRTKLVWLAINHLAGDSKAPGSGLTAADVGALLREQDTPMGAWEVRGELTHLEEVGLLTLDAQSGRWHVRADRETPQENAAGGN